MQVASPMFMMGAKVDLPDSGEDRLRKMLLGKAAATMLLGESSPAYAKMYADGLIMSDFSAEFEAVANTAYVVFGGEKREIPRQLPQLSSKRLTKCLRVDLKTDTSAVA